MFYPVPVPPGKVRRGLKSVVKKVFVKSGFPLEKTGIFRLDNIF